MTLGDFRRATAALSDNAEIRYWGYDKGCSLFPYEEQDLYIHTDAREGQSVVLNPGNDWDGRAARKARR